MPSPAQIKLGALSLIHVLVDGYSTFVTVLAVVLARHFELTPFQVNLIVALAMATSNFSQPVFGFAVERRDGRWLIVVGPLLAAVCMGLLGLSPWLGLTLFLIIVGKIGVGMFHPEAAVLATRLGSGNSHSMSIFMASGILGMGIGSWFISLVVGPEGETFSRTWITILPAIPVLVVAVALMRSLPRVTAVGASATRIPLTQALAGRHRATWCLMGAQLLRMVAVNVIFVAIPWYVDMYVGTQIDVGKWIFIYVTGQAVGILVCGATTGIRHERSVFLVSLVASVPLLVLLTVTGPSIAIVLLPIAGAMLTWTNPVAVRLGQQIVPDGKRWISGMIMGTTWGVASLIAPLMVGWSLQWSGKAPFAVGAIFLLLATVVALAIPTQRELDRLKTASLTAS